MKFRTFRSENIILWTYQRNKNKEQQVCVCVKKAEKTDNLFLNSVLWQEKYNNKRNKQYEEKTSNTKYTDKYIE